MTDNYWRKQALEAWASWIRSISVTKFQKRGLLFIKQKIHWILLNDIPYINFSPHRCFKLELFSMCYHLIYFTVFLSCNSCEMSICLMRLNFRSNRSSKVTLQSQENNIRRTNNNTSGLHLYLQQRGSCLDICTSKIIFTALTFIRDTQFSCPRSRSFHFNKIMINV